MTPNALPDYVRALLRKTTYPKPPRSIELIQTHISWVFLVDDEVFKLKKPVNLGFVDFSSLLKRRSACEAEIRLNRRGCPGGVYLGVQALTLTNGRYRLGGDAEVVDYLVHMRRLPTDGMMDHLLVEDRVDFEMVGRLAARVAELHVRAETSPEITRAGGTTTLSRNWRDNLSQLQPFIGRTLGERRLGRIEAYVSKFLRDEVKLLESREQDGWIRDCHGDLRSDAICFDASLPEGICIYDCIEFNDAFRYGDTGLDVAFLAMDLDFRGRDDLSDLFIGLYTATAGDSELPLLLNFYKCYRACVRGKVESILSADTGLPGRKRVAARRRAKAYLRLAEAYARQQPFRGIVLVSGPSGSGKSVLAGSLASRRGCALLATDIVRRRLFAQRGRPDAVNAGIYSPQSRQQVYDEMLRGARNFIADRRGLVVDGTFTKRHERQPFVQLTREAKEPLLVIECSAPDEVIRQRQARREGESWSTSEGRWEVYLAQKAEYEPPEEVPEAERLVLDTTLPLVEKLRRIASKLRK